MTLRHITQSIRTRITLWHLGVLVLTLGAYILSTQMFLWHQLTVELKTNLQEEAEEVVKLFLKLAPDGHFVWRGHQENTNQKYWIAVSHLDGVLIYRNFTQTDLSLPPASLTPVDQTRTLHTLQLTDGRKLLMMQEVRQIEGVDVVIRVGRTTEHFAKEMRHLLLIQTLCFPLVLLLAWAGGYFMAGRVLSPLQKIIARMKTISADRLHERLPVENVNDELGHLSLTFNHLLGKLDHSFKQMRQFTDDASHELRTPLSAMHSVGEMALRTSMNIHGYQETIASMLEEVEKMSRLVSDLLALARADSDMIKPVLTKLELGGVIKDETARLEVLAEEKKQELSLTIRQDCPVCIDRNIFRQAFANILYNAIQYSPVKGSIQILVDKDQNGCFIEISDSGSGIAPKHQERIFDRFYRVDKVRSRDTGSSGLGLAIAKWAVTINGGHIELVSTLGKGSTFRICLPEQQHERCPSHFSLTAAELS
ncbi:MAG: ATP-binding protein [Deltaproteobacteria bacterium]|nr:ATP-binding protein [Deltaproteobacteria bacterium]